MLPPNSIGASPYINLGQLYVAEARGDKVLQAFSSAVSAAPRSVAALATLSQCEYEFGDQNAAAIDLVRAKMAHPSTNYDNIALSRALFQRDSAASKQEGIERLQRAIPRNIFGEVLPRAVDSEVDLGRWIASTVKDRTDKTLALSKLDEAIAAFRDALKVRPVHIKANYQLAVALAVKRELDPNLSESERRTYHEDSRRYYLTALGAQAFSDDEFTDQGNAAFTLGENHLAAKLYGRAIGMNRGAVYAYSGLGELYRRSKKYDQALADYTIAANLHQRERALHEQVQMLSQLIRPRTLTARQPSMIAGVSAHR
jgi:tetratricopeptide (TPR) repeat protein